MDYDNEIMILKKIINYEERIKEIAVIDKEVNISTMTICCNFEDTEIKCSRIAKYMKLGVHFIVARGDESLLKDKHKKKKDLDNKKKRPFLNQISLKILVPGKNKNKPVNVKLFKNGSVQMTGCVTLQDSLDAIVRVSIALLANEYDEEKKKKIRFCDRKNLISKVSKYQIGMINSNFSIGFWIDRNRLLQVLKDDNLDVMFDSNSHASVKIKHLICQIVVTILVFEKGKIIITGVRNYNQLKNAYDFINKTLLTHYSKIYKLTTDIVLKISKNTL